jgi:hypothetical protein
MERDEMTTTSPLASRASALRRNGKEEAMQPSKQNGPQPEMKEMLDKLATATPAPPPTADEQAVAAAVQHHVASYKAVCNERDALLQQRDRIEQQLTINKIEIEGLRSELGIAQSRIQSYQAERDDAVANLTVYQTMYVSIMAQLRAFGIEHQPLIKEASDVQA